MTPIKRAVDAVGGQGTLANLISTAEDPITPQAVNQWVLGKRPVPSGRCIAIESACGGKVTRYDLRPDIFGPAPSRAPKKKAA